MSCIYCSSNNHTSQKCDIYKTYKARVNILASKNRCEILCKNSRTRCENCKKLLKCYICFSKNHYTADCSDRIRVSNLFPPNIDKNLFSRFFEILDLEEKFFMALSFPSVSALIKLKPIKVTYREYTGFLSTRIPVESDVIVADSFCNYRFEKQLKLPIIRITRLWFDLSNFSFNEIFYLLSTKTKTLELTDGDPKNPEKLIFQEIFKKAPNLEVIDFLEANIKINNTWPMDLLQLNLGKKLNLSLPLSTTAFNIKKLADLVKSKPVKIHLNITESDDYPKKGIYQNFKKNFAKYFVTTKCQEEYQICITFDNKPSEISNRLAEYYQLKNI